MVSRRRILMRRGVALAVLAALTGGVAVGVIAASSGEPAGKRATNSFSERGTDGDGWPLLIGEISETGAKGKDWQRCSPECGEVISHALFFRPGRTAAGTSFRLSAPDGDVVWEERTPVWQGRVKNTTLPTLSGQPTVGTTVTPHRGQWTGGWPDAGNTVGVRACRTARGDGCVAISRSLVKGAGRQTSVQIGPVYAGWYVGAVDIRSSALSTDDLMLQPPPRGDKVSRYPSPTPGPAVAVGPLRGPVTAN